MTRSALVTANLPRPDPARDPFGWRHELFLAALTGGLCLSVFDALFDRMERAS